MKTMDDDVSRLENALANAGTPALDVLNGALQVTKNIMDIVADAHPAVKASWTFMSAVYTAVQQAQLLDDDVRALAENLRETLGVAKEKPDLLVIEGTDDVIEEIGRTSLKIASLIREYTRLRFAGRVMKYQITSDMQSRIAQCQKSCDELKVKFDRRMNMDTNRQIKTIKDGQLADKIYQWLSAPDSSRNYNDARKKYQEGTCSWFLDGERFREFQEKANFLWIKGKAGSGKTIMCSSIIEKIDQLHKEIPSITFAYFFFDGRDEQKDLQLHDKLIRSLILQLSRQCDGIPAALVELHGGGYQQPSTKSLEHALYDLISAMPLVYIIIDSLDECAERQELLEWIKGIISRKISTLHMVVVSRPERDIEDVLQLLDPDCIDLAKEYANHDITIYVEEQLSALSAVKKWDEVTQTIIKSTLTERAEGMFRWVALQLMELKKCSNYRSVLNQLENLPKGLYETYDRILSKVDNEADRTDTRTFLQWLCFSVRPMSLAELAETIAMDFDMEDGPQYIPAHRYWDQRDVLEKCAGLITESEGQVKLAHFSIKEYLLSKHLSEGVTSGFHLISIETSHALISQTCLAYLLQFDAPNSLAVHINVATSFPLTPYAAKHWVSHAQSGGIDNLETSCTLTLAKKLFMSNSATFPNWVQLWDFDHNLAFEDIDFRMEPNLNRTTFAPALYYTSLLGLHQLSLHLSKQVDINAQGGGYGTALQGAVFRGHKAIVKLLVEQGADVNAQGGYYGNALQAASYKGKEATVELLLKNGADVNAQGGHFGNALQAASCKGKQAIVELLLNNGADVNAQGGYFGNALQAASRAGNEAIVELLLKNGADVHAQEGYFGNALQGASFAGREATIELLLKNGADVNAQGGFFGNTLQAASCEGKQAIVELLLKNGADVNAQGGYFGNALQGASFAGREATIELLLKNRADVNAQGGEYGNALRAAAWAGKEETVALLLKNGADVHAQGGEYGNALQAASFEGNEAIVELLLKNGADVNDQGGEFGNALQAASFEGNEAIVELLLKNGADVNDQGGEFGNALQAASCEGNKAIVELLLKNGADVNAQGGEYGSALQAASYEGKETTVELLLKNGADVHAQGGEFGNALQAATTQGHDSIVKLLLANGADETIST
ncbi:ectomycorrhiza-induced ankyrin-domain/NACHT-domain-containing protein [Pholiota molesta]|nr:ectomycorrhiza-induced ankyrin-domain/NACHT-domain-containing protein [Pholiota molesta]